MKKGLYIFVFFLFSNSVFSQVIYFGYGYSGSWNDLEGLNLVIDNYNKSRLWLDQEMGQFNYVDGFAINFGGAAANLWYDMDFVFGSQRNEAFGTDLNGDFGTRQLKLKNNVFGFNFGGIGGGDNAVFGGGLRMEVGGQKLKSRIFYEGEDKGEWELLESSKLVTRVGPCIKIIAGSVDGLMIGFSVYYLWGVINDNYTEIDEMLNNTDYLYETREEFDVSNNSFGFTISLGFLGAY